MNISGFIGMFAYAILYLLGRAGFLWIKRLSYESSAKSIRSVEKHYDEVKRKIIPYEKEITWLVRTSPMPVLTKVLYFLNYALTALPLAGIALSAVNLFVPELDAFMSRAAMCLMALIMFSFLCSIVFYTPLKHLINKSIKKRK